MSDFHMNPLSKWY